MNYIAEKYATKAETKIYSKKSTAKSSLDRKILMGTWVGILENVDQDGWYKIYTFGKEGYMRTEDLADNNFLKLFFIDVGQGDSVLIESPKKRLLVDSGPDTNLYKYLTRWKFKWLIEKGEKVRIDDIVISHFDYDHFNCFTKLLNDANFEIGTIHHNGIARFHTTKSQRLDKYDSELGTTNYSSSQKRTLLKTSFSTINDCKELLAEIPDDKKGLMSSFKKFLEAAVKANGEGRLNRLKRVTNRNDYLTGYSASSDFPIEVLGPVPTKQSGTIQYDWFKDDAHTSNGHSVVLKLHFGNKSILLGGDLNTLAENHLMDYYNNLNVNPFESDIAKSCHHGSSDFSVDFLDLIKPYGTVISSGDNESYAHPRADAIGCAGKYSRGERPLVLSTELARSVKSGKDIHYGLINVRTDGSSIVLAQMKESKTQKDLWDSYEV